MEFVQEPVHDRCEHHAHAGNESYAAEQRVERGEPLAGIVMQFVNGPHAGQNHRRIDQRIQPAESLTEMIPEDTHPEACAHQAQPESQMTQQAAVVSQPSCQRFLSVLEHAPSYTAFRRSRLEEFPEVFFAGFGSEDVGFVADSPTGGGHVVDARELG